MRRSRTSISSWPAVADLMIIFAVVGMGAAILFKVAGDRHVDRLMNGFEQELQEQKRGFEQQLGQMKEKYEDMLQDMKGGFAVREEDKGKNGPIVRKGQIGSAIKKFGSIPCVWLDGESDQPKASLQIDIGEKYKIRNVMSVGDWGFEEVSRRFPVGSSVVLDGSEFATQAEEIFHFGEARGACRFFVTVVRGRDFDRELYLSLGLVNKWFLFMNSSDVIRWRDNVVNQLSDDGELVKGN